jgi:DNA-binding transcriptional MerR regulator
LEKAPDAFRTISEVADDLDIPQHVLRFWESRFTQIKPMKRAGGRRYYRPDDVVLLRGIRHLLYGEGYTIRGVQRILKEQGVRAVQNFAQHEFVKDSAQDENGDDEHIIDTMAEDEVEDDANEAAVRSTPAASVEKARSVSREPIREPSLAPPVRVSVAPMPVTARAAQVGLNAGLDAEQRQQLEAALEELAACRKMLDAAASTSPSQ